MRTAIVHRPLLRACPTCARHVRSVDVRCPFCDARVSQHSIGPLAMALAVSAGITVSCSSVYGSPTPPEPSTDAGDASSHFQIGARSEIAEPPLGEGTR